MAARYRARYNTRDELSYVSHKGPGGGFCVYGKPRRTVGSPGFSCGCIAFCAVNDRKETEKEKKMKGILCTLLMFLGLSHISAQTKPYTDNGEIVAMDLQSAGRSICLYQKGRDAEVADSLWQFYSYINDTTIQVVEHLAPCQYVASLEVVFTDGASAHMVLADQSSFTLGFGMSAEKFRGSAVRFWVATDNPAEPVLTKGILLAATSYRQLGIPPQCKVEKLDGTKGYYRCRTDGVWEEITEAAYYEKRI